MAGQTYQVNYIINVDATQAQSAVNAFKRAVASMDKATKPLIDLQNKVRGLVQTMSALNKGKYSVKLDTKPATQKIGKLIRALQMAKAEVQQLNAMGVTLGGAAKNRSVSKNVVAPIGGSRSNSTPTSTTRTTATVVPSSRYTPIPPVRTGNLGYKLFGNTPLPSNGGMAIDMLKGMGIAYGIAGMGTLISNVVNQAAEYDNLMKTVENILKSHDMGVDFSDRFANMSSTIRNVGMETKYKVTEVADAAKFLAMAGLDVEAISESIRPIADIALIGDTELGKTADLVTNIMTAYNIAPSKMRNAADVMTNTFTMSNTTLTEIAEAYKYAASLLSAGDVPFEEATAAIGVLGDAGIKASQAGTTLRTIMANTVNPTKRQQKAWDEIKINRYNADGSRKSLIELFRELSQADLDVSVFYRLFHKTAASGAVALAAHVEKWQEVYLENYLSGGMSAMLADAKKNTFKGLWAQLMSVFVDRGVTAFSGVQGQLRSIMTTAISWLKSEKGAEAFKSVSKALMEFVHIMVQATKNFAALYKLIWPVLRIFIRFQLTIWPIVHAFKALRTVFFAVMGIRKLGLFIGGLGNSLRTLGSAAGFASTQMNGLAATNTRVAATNAGVMGGAGAITGYTGKWLAKGMPIGFTNHHMGFKLASKLNLLPPVYDTTSKDIVARHAKNRQILKDARKNQKKLNRRVAGANVANAVGGVAGAIALGYGINKLTDDNDTWQDQLAGGLFAGAGIAAMIGGPVGWGIAGVAALGGLIANYFGKQAKSKQIVEEMREFANQNVLRNGVITDSESTIMQHLELQYVKYNDINSLIEKRIELTAKLLGMQSGEDPTVGTTTGIYEGLMERNKDMVKEGTVESFNEMYKQRFETKRHLVNLNGKYYLTEADTLQSVLDDTGRAVNVHGPNGEEAIPVSGDQVEATKAAWASMSAAIELMSPGGYYEKYVEGLRTNVTKLALKGEGAETLADYFQQIRHAMNPDYINDLIPMSEIKNTDWDLNRMLKDLEARKIMWQELDQLITPMEQALVNFHNEKQQGNVSAATLRDFLHYAVGGTGGTAVVDYNPDNIASWYAHHGYINGRFDTLVQTDKDGVTRVYTPEENAKFAVANMQAITDAIKLAGLESEPAAKALMEFSNTLLTQAQAQIETTAELVKVYDGLRITVNGQLYRWNEVSNVFEAIDENGRLQYIQTQFRGLSDSIIGLGDSLAMFNWDSWADIPLPTTPVPENSPIYDPFDLLSTLAAGREYKTYPIATVAWDGKFGLPSTSTKNFLNRLGNPLAGALGKNLVTAVPNTLTQQEMTNVLFNSGQYKNKYQDQDQDQDQNGLGAKASDYESKYKNKAVPKQININIQNLMNVDSIDLTNENNAEIIGRVKREVAYALVEAASDGTMMLNNLTT